MVNIVFELMRPLLFESNTVTPAMPVIVFAEHSMYIGFHTNQISLRGTEIALFDYADFNESILGNRSVVFAPREPQRHDERALDKFEKRFKIVWYDNIPDLYLQAQREKIDVMYHLKSGFNDCILVPSCKNVVHAVFQYCEPHGDVYAYISPWLSLYASGGKYPYVPHIVRLPPPTGDMRRELNIPAEATVFGRHGGSDTFNIPYVRQIVMEMADIRPDLYFLFLNTDEFCPARKNILFLKGTSIAEEKQRFINTCDCMLHARIAGETFGLAIAEFSISNKPILTWGGSEERCHLDILKDKALIYNSIEELCQKIWSFDRTQNKAWDAYSEKFNPQVVMAQFKKVFLD